MDEKPALKPLPPGKLPSQRTAEKAAAAQASAPQPAAEPEIDASEPHPDYPGLTYGQVAEARANARKQLDKARVKAAMSRAENAEIERLEREEGLVATGVLGEMVQIKLDLAINTPWLAIDGKRFYHAHTYTVPRAVANDLLYMQWKTHVNEAIRLGEDRMSFYMKERAPIVNNVGRKVVSITRAAG